MCVVFSIASSLLCGKTHPDDNETAPLSPQFKCKKVNDDDDDEFAQVFKTSFSMNL
jgi:hypothetical protein